MSTVPETLHAFGPSTLAVRAVGALLAAYGDPSALTPYATVNDAVAVLAPGSSLSAAAAGASDPASSAILAIGAAVDGLDRQLARSGATGAEAQGADAALKALAIGALCHQLGGEARLLALPTGPALLRTWAAVDVALPLGGVDLKRFLAERQPAATSTFAAAVGEAALNGAPAALTALVPRLQAEVDQAAAQIAGLAAALAPYVPGLVPAEGSAELSAAAVATIAIQSDRLPIYKWLAARLATESAVLRAAGR